MKNCPPAEELLRYAEGGPTPEASSTHIAECAVCAEQVRSMRELIGALQSVNSSTSRGHASDETIAAMAAGHLRNVDAQEVSHVASCSECSSRLAMVANTLADPTVAQEIQALSPALKPRRSVRMPFAVAATLAAAAVLTIVLVKPADLRRQPVATRDSESAAEVRLITRSDEAAPGDSIRWTAVAGASDYQVRVWNTNGAVVFSTETRRNAIQVPSALTPGVEYFWEVKAQTDWDRWVESDLVPLKIHKR